MTTIFPIREMTTYSSRTWVIMARVTAKAPMKSYSTAARSGSLFSIDLLDKDGGEIRASFFNKSAEKFFPLIEQGKVYKLSRGNVKVANRKYSTINHTYELSFDEDAIIELQDDESGIEAIKFNFSRIRDIQTKQPPCSVDLIGVVREIKKQSKVNSKQGAPLDLKVVVVVDSTDCAVEVNLWQDAANKFEDAVLGAKPVVAFKGLSVREYNGGRQLSTGPASQLELNPTLPETAELRTWWEASGASATAFNISQGGGGARGSVGGQGPKECSIGDMRDDCSKGFLSAGTGLTFEILAYLSFVSTRGKDQETPIFYNACAACNRKLPEDRRCVGCDKIVEVNPRYLLRAQFMDHTNEAYLSVFHDQALPILFNKPVKDFIDAKDAGKSVADELKSSYWRQPWLLRVRAVAEEYKGETRPKITVMNCETVDYVSQTRKMLKKLEAKFGSFAPVEVGEENTNDLNLRKRKFDEVQEETRIEF